MPRPSLCILMICRNAERRIEEALKSAAFADEVLVTDTGSSDGTIEIAKKYATAFYQEPWTGFSNAKNMALSRAKSDWILILDSDEVIQPGLREEIISLLEKGPAESCHEIVFDNLIFGKNMGATMTKPVLFRRGSARFEGAVHERLIAPKPYGRLSGRILHYAYEDLEQYLEKFNRYTTLDAEELLAGPKLNLFHILVQGMLFRGLMDFVRRYFYRGLYRHGIEGFLFSFFSAAYRVAQYGKYALKTRMKK